MIQVYNFKLGCQGGELLGAAIKTNKILKQLSVSENNLKNDGAAFIVNIFFIKIKNAYNLELLNLSKN